MYYIKTILDYLKLFASNFRTNKNVYQIFASFISKRLSKISKDSTALKEILLARRMATALANAKCKDIITANKIDKDDLKIINEIRETNVQMNNELNKNIKIINDGIHNEQ